MTAPNGLDAVWIDCCGHFYGSEGMARDYMANCPECAGQDPQAVVPRTERDALQTRVAELEALVQDGIDEDRNSGMWKYRGRVALSRGAGS